MVHVSFLSMFNYISINTIELVRCHLICWIFDKADETVLDPDKCSSNDPVAQSIYNADTDNMAYTAYDLEAKCDVRLKTTP